MTPAAPGAAAGCAPQAQITICARSIVSMTAPSAVLCGPSGSACISSSPGSVAHSGKMFATLSRPYFPATARAMYRVMVDRQMVSRRRVEHQEGQRRTRTVPLAPQPVPVGAAIADLGPALHDDVGIVGQVLHARIPPRSRRTALCVAA